MPEVMEADVRQPGPLEQGLEGASIKVSLVNEAALPLGFFPVETPSCALSARGAEGPGGCYAAVIIPAGLRRARVVEW